MWTKLMHYADYSVKHFAHCWQMMLGERNAPNVVYLIVYREKRVRYVGGVSHYYRVPCYEIRDRQDHIVKYGHCHSLAACKKVVVREYQKGG